MKDTLSRATTTTISANFGYGGQPNNLIKTQIGQIGHFALKWFPIAQILENPQFGG